MGLTKYIAAAFLLVATTSPLHLLAQVFEVSAGASTAYGAEGGSILIHGDRSETQFGAGLVQGRLSAGGESVRPIRGGQLTLGQQQMSVILPTDVFDAAHILVGTGVGVQLASSTVDHLSLFAGYSSQDGGTPLFRTSVPQKRLLFGQWLHPLSGKCSAASSVLISTNSAFLQSIQCGRTWDLFQYAATIGIGAGVPYAAASVVIKQRRLNLKASFIYAGDSFKRGNDASQPTPEPVRENVAADYKLTSRFTFSGTHQNYLTPVWPAPDSTLTLASSVRSKLDTASMRYQKLSTTLGFSFLHSDSEQTLGSKASLYKGHNQAVTATLHENIGRVQWDENLLRTLGGTGADSSLLVNALSIQLTQHLRVSETIDVTGAGVTYAHGGGFLTRYSSFNLDYQLFYLANRAEAPFQQAMIFDARLRLPRNLALHAASSIGPTGQTQYTVELTTMFARNAFLPDPISHGGLGTNVIQGRVIDTQEKPVEGAVLLIGKERVYTGSDGLFFYREKRSRTHPFRVLTGEFMGVDKYSTHSTPSEVRSSRMGETKIITVVVDHALRTSRGDGAFPSLEEGELVPAVPSFVTRINAAPSHSRITLATLWVWIRKLSKADA